MEHKSRKNFCVVCFPNENNSLAVVPSVWLSENTPKCICFWPTGFSSTHLKKAVKEQHKPDKKKWRWYPCQIVSSSKTYERAKEKMRKYQYQNDVEAFSPDTDTEKASQEVLVTSNVNEEQSFHSIVNTSVQPVLDIQCTNCVENERKLEFLMAEVENLKKLVMEVKVHTTQMVQNMPPSALEFQQLSCMEELIEFNSSLEDSEVFSKMMNYLRSFGGKDKHSATRKILSILISNELALKLNWIGGAKKRSIQEYKLVIQLVAASVRNNKNFSDATVTEIERWIARWLRYAADRCGTKKRKIEQKENITELQTDIQQKHPLSQDCETFSSESDEQPLKKQRIEGNKCAKCEFHSINREEFKKHILSHKTNRSTFQCQECGLCFVVEPALNKHLRIEHKISDTKKYISDEGTNYMSDLENPDEGSKRGALECTVCFTSFSNETALKTHMRSHVSYIQANKSGIL